MSCSSTLPILHPLVSPHPFISLLIPHSLCQADSCSQPKTLCTQSAPDIAKMLDIWKFPFQALVFGVSLSVCMHSASGIKVEVIPKSPKKGDSVTLKVSDISGSIRFATWYRGKSTDATDQILNYFPREEFKGPKYIEGSRGQADGSLSIDSVSEDLNGDYTVQIQTTDSLQQATVYLAVSGVISIALSPLVPLLGLLLFSELNFL